MDILDRTVVSWVGTVARTFVGTIGDALVDDSQRAGAARETMIER